jgi:hypothetical protein
MSSEVGLEHGRKVLGREANVYKTSRLEPVLPLLAATLAVLAVALAVAFAQQPPLHGTKLRGGLVLWAFSFLLSPADRTVTLKM